MSKSPNEKAARPLRASAIQEKVYQSLKASRNLAKEPDGFLSKTLGGYSYSQSDLNLATDSIYRELYYSYASDLEIDNQESRRIDELVRLLELEERSTSLNYQVGLAIYKKRFREISSTGNLTQEGKATLDQIRSFFDLRKSDIKKEIANQALAYYSFRLSEAIKDNVVTEDEMADLALICQEYGLTSKHLSTISIPQKREVLSTALNEIKANGRIDERDRDYVGSLARFLNAGDLLKPCMKDLDLYEMIFKIRDGDLPETDPGNLILESGEKLHYKETVVYERSAGGKTHRRRGTLYVGSFRMRFVGQQSHEVKYNNILETQFKILKNPKLIVAVSSGRGGGNYQLAARNSDPGKLLEIQECIVFLIRKARGLIRKEGLDSRYIPSDVRTEVYYRDGGQCVICGSKSYLEYDHIIPHSKGGATSVDNLQLLCRGCNSEKSDKI